MYIHVCAYLIKAAILNDIKGTYIGRGRGRGIGRGKASMLPMSPWSDNIDMAHTSVYKV